MNVLRIFWRALVIMAKVLWLILIPVLVVGFSVVFIGLGFCVGKRGTIRRTKSIFR